MAWRKGVVVEKNGRRLTLVFAAAAFNAVAITPVFAQSESNNGSASARTRYFPEYTASSSLSETTHGWPLA